MYYYACGYYTCSDPTNNIGTLNTRLYWRYLADYIYPLSNYTQMRLQIILI
ncbi:hypothetical protein GPLA_1539 [Paraglaciecola polaris LMG 21857]|uniref:Uncharacterized protein n=1 Tax=Paraglaciecola polaris LMG 21857 TaxID=1129793 RepID=K6ZUH3_9ALTE|nr:hypothetical protein GPLA_1539 [Paraglaciecola polaris LMG 21857]